MIKFEGDRYNIESADEDGRALGVFGPQLVTLLADSALQLLELDVVPDKPGVVAQSVLPRGKGGLDDDLELLPLDQQLSDVLNHLLCNNQQGYKLETLPVCVPGVCRLAKHLISPPYSFPQLCPI